MHWRLLLLRYGERNISGRPALNLLVLGLSSTLKIYLYIFFAGFDEMFHYILASLKFLVYFLFNRFNRFNVVQSTFDKCARFAVIGSIAAGDLKKTKQKQPSGLCSNALEAPRGHTVASGMQFFLQNCGLYCCFHQSFWIFCNPISL